MICCFVNGERAQKLRLIIPENTDIDGISFKDPPLPQLVIAGNDGGVIEKQSDCAHAIVERLCWSASFSQYHVMVLGDNNSEFVARFTGTL